MKIKFSTNKFLIVIISKYKLHRSTIHKSVHIKKRKKSKILFILPAPCIYRDVNKNEELSKIIKNKKKLNFYIQNRHEPM